jgi:teichoic acid transport system permease protein
MSSSVNAQMVGAGNSLHPHVAGVGEILSLWTNRRALKALALHDLKKNYASASRGVLWTLLTPLITVLVFSAVFAFGLRIPLGGAPYFFGFAAAFVPWVLLSSAITGATGSIVEHRYLVKRVLFPLEIIPADPFLVHSVSHALLLSLVVTACLIGGYGRFPNLLLILYFYACAALLTISVGLLVSSLTVVARDFQQMLPAILQLWFWLTPIAWSSAHLPPKARMLLAINPASYIVSGYRHALMPGVFAAPTGSESAAFWIICLGTLVLGSICFRRFRVYFWDCL